MASPAIVFFDEIDAIAPRRGLGYNSGVTERVISQLLTEMDGLGSLDDVVVIAATNRPDILDPALLRSGRLDRLILVDAPDEQARQAILETYLKNMPLTDDVTSVFLASKTTGFAGSDIATLCREAGIIALRENINTKEVALKHFKESLKKVHPTISDEMVNWYRKIRARLYKRRDIVSSKEIL
jgi:transitional endoplasmic reticulum ATPase